LEREEKLASETDAELQDLDQRYSSALQELDEEWQTPEKKQIYSKPSAKLLNMRAMVKGMIKARRFADVDLIGKQIEDQEQRESAEAATKMQRDYEIANQKLVELSEAERIGIEGKGETAMNALIRAREVDLRPYRQVVENLRRIREAALANQKQISCVDSKHANQQQSTRLAATRVPAFVHSPRLTVPTFTPKRRAGSSNMPSQRRICRPKSSIATAPGGNR
jgi:hypothetical protein